MRISPKPRVFVRSISSQSIYGGGFNMELNQELMIGSVYARDAIHSLYGGQRGLRISTPKAAPVVLLFARKSCDFQVRHGVDCGSPEGEHSCALPEDELPNAHTASAELAPYVSDPEEGWRDDGFYHFRGEKHVQFLRGNRAVRDHARDGKLLFLFEETTRPEGRQAWRFIGPMECAGYYFAQASAGRMAIMFRLAPVYAIDRLRKNSQELVLHSVLAERCALDFLNSRHGAIAASAESTRPGHHSNAWKWSSDCALIQRYALDRAFGFCESCGKPSPFSDPDGEPYLEPHYMLRPYDSGVDPVHGIAACCPECHRMIHDAWNGRSHDVALARKIALLERSVDRGDFLAVTAAVIRNAEGKVLLTQRGHGALAGKWEFPGGKIEPGETLEACLAREIREELNLDIADIRPLVSSFYQYDDSAVRLFGLSANAVGNQLELREHISKAWVWPHELESYDLASADLPIAAVAARLL